MTISLAKQREEGWGGAQQTGLEGATKRAGKIGGNAGRKVAKGERKIERIRKTRGRTKIEKDEKANGKEKVEKGKDVAEIETGIQIQLFL